VSHYADDGESVSDAPPQSLEDKQAPVAPSVPPTVVEGSPPGQIDAADEHFLPVELHGDLRGRTLRDAAISLAGQACRFTLTLGSTVILARLLTPADFGLIAMVASVVGFVSLIKDGGLSLATVQRQQINHQQLSNLFWLNVALSIACAVITVAAAPVLAWFYHTPLLLRITMALAITFPLGGLTVQHQALMQRQMRFRALAAIDVLSLFLGVTAAIVAAKFGAGYWSLVIQPIVTSLVNMIGDWLNSGWRPSLPRRGSGVREMAFFGGGITGFNALNYLSRNADNIMIGRAWGADALGFYAKAYQLLTFPLNQLNAPLGAVAVTGLSRLLPEPERYRRYYLQAVSLISFLTMPFAALSFVLAEEMVVIALGPQWAPAARIFRFLAICAVTQPITSTCGWLYITTGQTGRMVTWGLISVPIILASFAVGLHFGTWAVAAAYSTVIILITPYCIYFATRGTPVRPADLLNAGWAPTLSGVLGGLAAAAVKYLLPLHLGNVGRLLLCTAAFSAVYLVFVLYVFGKKQMYAAALRDIRRC